jgi:hypothetical protein
MKSSRSNDRGLLRADRSSAAYGISSLLLSGIVALLPLSVVSAQTPGLVPLNDLGAGSYKGYQGGLYPGGSSTPPAAHAAAALQKGAQIVPRSILGDPDPNGWIVMVAVGMSNTTHEFAVFERTEDASAQRNARVVIMDTAFGGQNATAVADPNAGYWTVMMQRLSAMGLSAAQVQVAWLKEAESSPPDNFPVHAQGLRDNLERIANNLHDKFPHIQLCYVSSRTYGGYSPPGTLNPEPQAYESGFSVKWLIEDQILGDPGLNHDPAAGPVRSPLLVWGPYLWANGPSPRSDGLTWSATDFESDMVHPAPSGEMKVAQMLSGFFAVEPSAAAWWPAGSQPGNLEELRVFDAVKDASVRFDAPGSNAGSASQLLVQGGAAPVNAHLGFDVTTAPLPTAMAKLSLRVIEAGGGFVHLVPDTSWGEGTITWSNAPPAGGLQSQMPQSSRDGTVAANVTAAVNADPDRLLSLRISSSAAVQQSYPSREGGQPPRLVLVAPRSCPGTDGDADGRADVCDCLPADGGSFAAPPEVSGLAWTGPATLAWDSLSPRSGSSTLYDVMAGDLAQVALLGGGPADRCLAGAEAGTALADPLPAPSPGEGWFYLVRGRNGCGTGRYEIATDGRDRLPGPCP